MGQAECDVPKMLQLPLDGVGLNPQGGLADYRDALGQKYQL